MRGVLSSHRHGSHTEFLTVPHQRGTDRFPMPSHRGRAPSVIDPQLRVETHMSTKPPYFAMAIALGLWLATTAPASAYIGPGAGITMLGALWGAIMAVVI